MNNTQILFVAWNEETEKYDKWKPVGKLEFVSNGNSAVYQFRYTRGALTLGGFHPFVGLDDIASVYESDELFPLFANRLISKSRPGYAEYLQQIGLSASDTPTPIDILSITEGRRVTDHVEVFPAPQRQEQSYLNRFFLHGIHRLKPYEHVRIDTLRTGESLTVYYDNASPNSGLVEIKTDDGVRIGYLPRYLAEDVRVLMHDCKCGVSITVKQSNINSPFQYRVLCEMTSCWPDNFAPCSGDDFQPIVTC